MVLLTAVPVSGPGSIVTGVMVATKALAPAPAVGGASAVGGATAAPAAPPAGAGAADADMSLVAPPNMSSMSEQPASPKPAVSTHAKKRPVLSLRLAECPLILLSAAGAPAPKKGGGTHPNPLGRGPSCTH